MAEVYGNIAPGTVVDSHIAAGANLAASKLQHQYAKTFGQPLTAATSETRVIHVCKGAVGEVVAFKAGSIGVAAGNATVTVDLKKNGGFPFQKPGLLFASLRLCVRHGVRHCF